MDYSEKSRLAVKTDYEMEKTWHTHFPFSLFNMFDMSPHSLLVNNITLFLKAQKDTVIQSLIHCYSPINSVQNYKKKPTLGEFFILTFIFPRHRMPWKSGHDRRFHSSRSKGWLDMSPVYFPPIIRGTPTWKRGVGLSTGVSKGLMSCLPRGVTGYAFFFILSWIELIL